MSLVKQAYLGIPMSLADVHFFVLRPIKSFHLFINYPLLGLSLLGVGMPHAPLVAGAASSLDTTRHRFGSMALAMGAAIMAKAPSQSAASGGDVFAAFKTMYEVPPIDGVVARLNAFFDNRSAEATLPSPREQTRFVVPDTSMADSTGIQPDIFSDSRRKHVRQFRHSWLCAQRLRKHHAAYPT